MLAAPLIALLTASIIVDTDVGSDDLIAMAFLLSRQDVHIEAITVANGLAHVQSGARNLLRLLALAGHREIQVYVGRELPLQVTAPFPAEWRKISDELPGVTLPRSVRGPEKMPADVFLAQRLKRGQATIVALGPLTNLATAFQREPSTAGHVERLTIMGGAMQVPGNLGDGGLFPGANKTAEWNMFVDPLAAQIVFRSAPNVDLVPLDATSKVPIDLSFLKEFQNAVKTPLGRFAAQVLETDRSMIEAGYFQAWDPLAAVSLVQPEVLRWQRMRVEVQRDGPDTGRTLEVSGRSNARVAVGADAAGFRRVFLRAFQ